MNYSVCRVNWQQAEPLLKNIREKVFICEWRIPKSIEFDKHDKHAFHVLVCDDNTQEAIATGRIIQSGQISRIAVLPQYRQFQLDKVIIKELIKIAHELALAEVYVNSPLDKVEHYQNHNFVTIDHVYMEAGIARQRMVCLLSEIGAAKYYLAH